MNEMGLQAVFPKKRRSMNGKGRSIDNIAIERFFKTLKYDEIYLNDYANVAELRKGIDDLFA